MSISYLVSVMRNSVHFRLDEEKNRTEIKDLVVVANKHTIFSQTFSFF